MAVLTKDPEFDSVAGITYVVQFSTSATFPDDPRSIEKAQTIPNVVGTSIAIPLSLLLLERENIAGQGKTLHLLLMDDGTSWPVVPGTVQERGVP